MPQGRHPISGERSVEVNGKHGKHTVPQLDELVMRHFVTNHVSIRLHVRTGS
jgi:hypothetical protein